MTNNVRHLAPAERTADADVIRALTEMLERAQRGEIIALAAVEVNPARCATTQYICGTGYHTLNSGVARLAHRIAGEQGEEI